MAVGYASAYPTPAASFQSAWAQAYVDWLTNLRASFVADSTTTAQDDANYQETIASLGDNLADEIATEQITFSQTDAPAAASEAQALDVADDGYSVSVVDHLTDDANLTAAADSTWDIGIATAASAFLLGNAEADKDSQIASAQVPLGGSPLAARQIYIKETADAQLTLTTSQANADQGWITSNAAADSGFLNDDAIAWDGMVHTEATAADDFAHTDDEAAQTEADDIGADEADTIMPEAQADETQSAGDATANSNFTIAQANQTAAEWSSLASSLAIPWADAQSGIAAALATWAATAASNYQAFITKLGLAETDYATSDVTQFTNEFKKIDLADLTDGNAVADADEILAGTLADGEMGTEQATATGDDGFWVSVGEANHDYRVAQAQAIHDALVGGPMADYTAAMTVAAVNKAAALNGAITQFHVVVDPAVASQTTGDAQATFTDDKAFDDAQLDDTTQADEATDTYSDLESGDYDTEERADNQAAHDLAISDSDGQAAAIVAYDQANPSPWADQAAAAAQAQATRTDAQADAEITADNATADAQEAQEISQADAAESEDLTNAQSSHGGAVNQSQQAEDVASSSPMSEPDPLIAPDDGDAPTLTPDYAINYTAGNLTLKNSSEDFLSLPKGVPSYGENQEPGAPNMMPFWDPASIQLPWGGTMPYGLAHTFTPGNFLVVPGYSLFYTMPLADSSITTGSDYESSISPGMTVTLAGGNWANGTPSSSSNLASVLFATPQQAAGKDGGSFGGGGSGGGGATGSWGPSDEEDVQDTRPMDKKGDTNTEEVNAARNNPSVTLNDDNEIIAIDGHAIAPTSLEFLHDNSLFLWLAITNGQKVEYRGVRRPKDEYGGVGGDVEGLWAVTDGEGGVKTVTGPGASAEKRAIRARDEQTLRHNDRALAVTEAGLKTGKIAGHVADVILIVKAAAKFGIKQLLKWLPSKGAATEATEAGVTAGRVAGNLDDAARDANEVRAAVEESASSVDDAAREANEARAAVDAEASASATSTLSKGEAFEESVKTTFQKKIIRDNEILRDNAGKVLGEIDFETKEAIVEVGISLKGKVDQLHKLAAVAAERGKRLDVIYGPDTSRGTLEFLKESLRKKWGNRVRFIPHE